MNRTDVKCIRPQTCNQERHFYHVICTIDDCTCSSLLNYLTECVGGGQFVCVLVSVLPRTLAFKALDDQLSNN